MRTIEPIGLYVSATRDRDSLETNHISYASHDSSKDLYR